MNLPLSNIKNVLRITYLCLKVFYSILSGKRSTIVECIVTDKRTAVDDVYCAELTKPNTRVVTCNYGPCPPRYEGCSNINASGFIILCTHMLQQNGKRFYKGLYVTFKLAPDIKQNTVYILIEL